MKLKTIVRRARTSMNARESFRAWWREPTLVAPNDVPADVASIASVESGSFFFTESGNPA
jgi:hypothetical protein